MFGALDNSALLAVPFFIFAGEIMGTGGISRRLVDWSRSLFGGTRAEPADHHHRDLRRVRRDLRLLGRNRRLGRPDHLTSR